MGVFPLPFIPSSPRRRLSEPEAARGGEEELPDEYFLLYVGTFRKNQGRRAEERLTGIFSEVELANQSNFLAMTIFFTPSTSIEAIVT